MKLQISVKTIYTADSKNLMIYGKYGKRKKQLYCKIINDDIYWQNPFYLLKHNQVHSLIIFVRTIA